MIDPPGGKPGQKKCNDKAEQTDTDNHPGHHFDRSRHRGKRSGSDVGPVQTQPGKIAERDGICFALKVVQERAGTRFMPLDLGSQRSLERRSFGTARPFFGHDEAALLVDNEGAAGLAERQLMHQAYELIPVQIENQDTVRLTDARNLMYERHRMIVRPVDPWEAV